MFFKPFDSIRAGENCLFSLRAKVVCGCFHQLSSYALASEGIIYKGVIDIHKTWL